MRLSSFFIKKLDKRSRTFSFSSCSKTLYCVSVINSLTIPAHLQVLANDGVQFRRFTHLLIGRGGEPVGKAPQPHSPQLNRITTAQKLPQFP